jgi:hypothetical protein
MIGQVSASSTVASRTVLIDAAEPETVLAAVADHQVVRPQIPSPHYSGSRK